MSKTIAVVASVTALMFANAAWAGSNSSFFYHGGGYHGGHGGGYGHGGGGEGSDDGVCKKIKNPILRYICYKLKDGGPEHPASP